MLEHRTLLYAGLPKEPGLAEGAGDAGDADGLIWLAREKATATYYASSSFVEGAGRVVEYEVGQQLRLLSLTDTSVLQQISKLLADHGKADAASGLHFMLGYRMSSRTQHREFLERANTHDVDLDQYGLSTDGSKLRSDDDRILKRCSIDKVDEAVILSMREVLERHGIDGVVMDPVTTHYMPRESRFHPSWHWEACVWSQRKLVPCAPAAASGVSVAGPSSGTVVTALTVQGPLLAWFLLDPVGICAQAEAEGLRHVRKMAEFRKKKIRTGLVPLAVGASKTDRPQADVICEVAAELTGAGYHVPSEADLIAQGWKDALVGILFVHGPTEEGSQQWTELGRWTRSIGTWGVANLIDPVRSRAFDAPLGDWWAAKPCGNWTRIKPTVVAEYGLASAIAGEVDIELPLIE